MAELLDVSLDLPVEDQTRQQLAEMHERIQVLQEENARLPFPWLLLWLDRSNEAPNWASNHRESNRPRLLHVEKPIRARAKRGVFGIIERELRRKPSLAT